MGGCIYAGIFHKATIPHSQSKHLYGICCSNRRCSNLPAVWIFTDGLSYGRMEGRREDALSYGRMDGGKEEEMY